MKSEFFLYVILAISLIANAIGDMQTQAELNELTTRVEAMEVEP